MPTRRLLRLGNGDGAFPYVPMDASLLVVGVAVAWLGVCGGELRDTSRGLATGAQFPAIQAYIIHGEFSVVNGGGGGTTPSTTTTSSTG